jgi:hypothetical protein
VTEDRTYHGERNAGTDAPADRGELVVYVRERGSIHPLLEVGPGSGLEWGYSGAGPGKLAISLLADALDLDDADSGDLREAHQVFKRQVISRLPHQGWSMPRAVVLEWFRRWRDGGELPPEACELCGTPDAKVRDGDMAWCDDCWKTMGGGQFADEAP